MTDDEPLTPGRGFDPFNDRQSRDLRNTLSEQFVEVALRNDVQAFHLFCEHWEAVDMGGVYRDYLNGRLRRYRQAFEQFAADDVRAPIRQALVLWNVGLYFEVHELLETIWHPAEEPLRSALKGVIQAAGVHIHLIWGHQAAAEKLAAKAHKHLSANREGAAFIANLDELLAHLERVDPQAPVLYWQS
ncbi:MAG: DUF309 domain-containing protein [Desulfosarcinaceae bacterium]|nr:DUF309 domain-containing protein [Desulfosarcinaceae bacterium]